MYILSNEILSFVCVENSYLSVFEDYPNYSGVINMLSFT